MAKPFCKLATKGCHPERSEGSREPAEEILRCGQDESREANKRPPGSSGGLLFAES